MARYAFVAFLVAGLAVVANSLYVNHVNKKLAVDGVPTCVREASDATAEFASATLEVCESRCQLQYFLGGCDAVWFSVEKPLLATAEISEFSLVTHRPKAIPVWRVALPFCSRTRKRDAFSPPPTQKFVGSIRAPWPRAQRPPARKARARCPRFPRASWACGSPTHILPPRTPRTPRRPHSRVTATIPQNQDPLLIARRIAKSSTTTGVRRLYHSKHPEKLDSSDGTDHNYMPGSSGSNGSDGGPTSSASGSVTAQLKLPYCPITVDQPEES